MKVEIPWVAEIADPSKFLAYLHPKFQNLSLTNKVLRPIVSLGMGIITPPGNTSLAEYAFYG